MKDKPVERDVDRMRELLARTPPTDPALAGRAEAVVRRARTSRRRRGVIGGIAVALFAAAVIVTPHFLKTSPTTNEATDPTNGADLVEQGTAFTADPCPRDPVDVSKPDPVQALPTDPASIRLCRAQTLQPGWQERLASQFLAPQDALVTQTAEFVTKVADAPAYDAGECAAVDYIPNPFALVLTGQDGQSVVLGASAPICNAVSIGGRQVSTDWLTATFMDALERQREAIGAPSEPPLPRCSGDVVTAYSTFVNESPTAFEDVDREPGLPVAGVLCSIEAGPDGVVRGGDLDQEQARALADDAAANQSGEDGECGDLEAVRVVVLVDAWGDATAWSESGCEGGFQHDGKFWKPSPDSEAILTDALAGGVD